MTRRWSFCASAVLLAATVATAEAKTYVVSAGQWSDAHAAAVAASGGRVVFSHRAAGLAVVESGAEGFAGELLATGLVDSVAEDMLVQWQQPLVGETVVTPGDETFYSIQWAPKAVGAPGAWAAGFTGKGVRVAILDGGIHSTHIDLVANLDVANSASFVPGQPFNADTGTFWHGTHVAGIVAAADNGIGTIGIAPEATLVGVKVLHNGSGAFSWVISGILYAATPIAAGGGGADIINMSLGAVFGRSEEGAGELIAALNKAVNYADRFGVLVVSAAGNDALDLDHSEDLVSVPAESGSGIAVSSTGPMGLFAAAPMAGPRNPASYTNYGTSAIHVAGPGGDFAYPGNELCTQPRYPVGTITNFCWVFDMVLSTSRGAAASTTSYSWAAGTSMAAPAVSAVAALVKQANPRISLGALKTKLAQSADDEGKKGADPYYGKGFVNAEKAVKR